MSKIFCQNDGMYAAAHDYVRIFMIGSFQSPILNSQL